MLHGHSHDTGTVARWCEWPLCCAARQRALSSNRSGRACAGSKGFQSRIYIYIYIYIYINEYVRSIMNICTSTRNPCNVCVDGISQCAFFHCARAHRYTYTNPAIAPNLYRFDPEPATYKRRSPRPELARICLPPPPSPTCKHP